MSFIAGFGLGLSLIMAIGAQNAFVLRQGLAREHRFAVCMCCALSDALLIGAGVAGFGALLETAPHLVGWMRYSGAAFLLSYAFFAARSAIVGTSGLMAAQGAGMSRWRTLTICLALTWLNPHVYIDTVVLLGSVAATYGDQRMAFGVGATCASFVFFFTLGYGAQVLKPLFSRSVAWRILDGLVAILMAVIGMRLLVGAG